MRRWAILLLAPALASCAIAPTAAEIDSLFADRLFRPPSEPVEPAQVFAASEEMKRYLAVELGDRPASRGRQQRLVDALRDHGQLRLEYDAAFTRNAAQAFAARMGNCLSLVIMTAALAREIGVEVRYQEIYVEENWSRRGDLYVSVGHVNLTLGSRPRKLGTRVDEGEQLTIDFLPVPDLRRIKWRALDESTVLAMYMNNRAAEALAGGRIDDAYWFAREAIRQDPRFTAAFNTLGVVYQRGGHLEEAARVLGHALEHEPRNVPVMSNLAPILASLGKVAQSRELERRLAILEPDPPFVFFHRGIAAMRAKDFAAARELFEKEVGRDPYNDEFHFWLAAALANLGKALQAQRHLALALQNSTTRKARDLYAGKLERLRSAGLN